MSSDTLMQACAELSRLVGAKALEYYGHEITVETKRDGSPVTIADRTAEQTAREWLSKRFPDDGILGEEFGAVKPSARRRWIIDPIDGTKSFVRGVPLWGSLIAVAEGESVLAGSAFFPAVNEHLAAAPGAGCWWNELRCSVSTIDSLSSATVLVTDDLFGGNTPRVRAWNELASRSAVSRTWGDCYGYLLVATGRAEVMLDDRMNPWDAAALFPIINEAGGVFTDWRGRATAFGGDSIATNSALASTVRELLGPAELPGDTKNA